MLGQKHCGVPPDSPAEKGKEKEDFFGNPPLPFYRFYLINRIESERNDGYNDQKTRVYLPNHINPR